MNEEFNIRKRITIISMVGLSLVTAICAILAVVQPSGPTLLLLTLSVIFFFISRSTYNTDKKLEEDYNKRKSNK